MKWLRMLSDELPLLRDLPDFDARPLPRVVVSLGPTVPGWALRAAAAVLAGGLVGIASQRLEMAAGVAWTISVLAVAVMAIWASLTVAGGVVVLSGLLIAGGGHGPFDPVVLALIPLAYLLVRLAWWAERVSLPARVEWAALAVGVPRGIVLVGATVAFGALGGRPNPWAVVAGGVALVALAGLALLRR